LGMLRKVEVKRGRPTLHRTYYDGVSLEGHTTEWLEWLVRQSRSVSSARPTISLTSFSEPWRRLFSARPGANICDDSAVTDWRSGRYRERYSPTFSCRNSLVRPRANSSMPAKPKERARSARRPSSAAALNSRSAGRVKLQARP